MRLSEQQVSIIKEEIYKKDESAEIYLFGSRADDLALGGDIDLLVISEKIDFHQKIRIQAQLFIKLDEQQVDMLAAKDKKKAFVKLAIIDGIQL